MKKINLLITAMLFAGNCAMQAQNENDVIVKDQRGQEEVIALPEGMTLNIDSLMTDYNARPTCNPTPTATTRTSTRCFPKRCISTG